MNLKMYEILGFEGIYNKLQNTKMPLRVAYKFSKLASEIQKEKNFYQTKLQSIVDAYGEKDADGNFILTPDQTGVQIKKEDLEQCQKEVSELSNLEVEINGTEFTLEELGSFDLTLQEIQNLMPFIKE